MKTGLKSEKLVGTRGAEAVGVMEGMMMTRNHRRKNFTSWLVATAITFTVFQAESFSFSNGKRQSARAAAAAFQMKRNDQKAPYDLSFWKAFDNPRLVVGVILSLMLGFGFDFSRRLLMVEETIGFSPWQNNAFGSPRGPPLEGPIF